MCLCSPKNKKHNPQLSVLVKNNIIFVRLSSTVAHFYLSCFERPLLVKSELTHHHYHRSHCCQRFYQNLLFATIWANGETKNTNQQNSEVCEVITQARCVVRAAVVFSAAIIIPAAVSICMLTDIKHHPVHTNNWIRSVTSRIRTYCFYWSSSKHTGRPCKALTEKMFVDQRSFFIIGMVSHIFKGQSSYFIGDNVVECDCDVLLQVSDRSAGVGHAGWHHKGVEGLPVFAALEIIKTYMCKYK